MQGSRKFNSSVGISAWGGLNSNILNIHDESTGNDIDKVYSRKQVVGAGYIDKVVGSLMSAEEIHSIGSICDMSDHSDDATCLNRPDLGAREPGEECPTCFNKFGRCNGHFGKMSIPSHAWFIHPYYIKVVSRIMNLFCFTCFKRQIADLSTDCLLDLDANLPEAVFLYDSDTIELFMSDNFNITNGEDRIKALAKLRENKQKGCPNPSGGPGHICTSFKSIKNELKIVEVIKSGKINKEIDIDIPTIKCYLKSITKYFEADPDRYDMIGFRDLKFENFVISVILVLPSCNRQSVSMGGRIKESDFTTLYRSMLNIINDLKTKKDEHSLIEARARLREAFFHYINNKDGAKGNNNAEPMKTFSDMMNKKEGWMRKHIVSTRVDNSGRTVVTGDNTLLPHQVGVPSYMAKKFRIPLKVTTYNKEHVDQLIENGIVVMLTRLPSGIRTVITDSNRNIRAKEGDIAERILVTGDIIIANRQPTLHRFSIMAHEAVVDEDIPGEPESNTLRFNTAVVSGYNMDFDGDEAHIHVPMSVDARAQAAYLMAVQNVPISDQTSTNVFGLIQNTVWGLYEITKRNPTIEEDEWYRLAKLPQNISQLPHAKEFESGWDFQKRVDYVLDTAPGIFMKKGLDLDQYNGYTLISLAFPSNFSYSKRIEKGDDICIENGIYCGGIMNKSVSGSGANSITQMMYSQFGPQAILIYVHVMQQVVQEWMTTVGGFTISISSFLPDRKMVKKIEEVKKTELRKVRELAQRNTAGVFNKDNFDEVLRLSLIDIGSQLDSELTEDESARLINEISFDIFKVVQVEINSFLKGLTDEPYEEAQIIKTLTKSINKVVSTNDSRYNDLHDGLKDVVLQFLEKEASNPEEYDNTSEKSKFERAELESDTMDTLENLGTNIANEIVLSDEQLEKNDPLNSMIDSRARGKLFNLTQSKFGLSQQTKSGRRLAAEISGNRRVVPFFMENDIGPEALGWIDQSYINGLSVTSYISASIPNRQTQTDTSLKTAHTGYMQRRLQASMGDYSIMPDGSVRNEKGEIITYLYGGHGFDAARMFKVGDSYSFVNIEALKLEIDSEFDSDIKTFKEFIDKF